MAQSAEFHIDGDHVSIKLGSVLDLAASDNLREKFLEASASVVDLEVDGSAVDRVGTACLQVLLSAAKTMRSRGGRFSMRQTSPALRAGMIDLGLQDELMRWEV